MKILKDYRIFDTKEELQDLEELLKENNLKYFIQESNEIADKKYLLQLSLDDFQKVDELCEKLVEIDLNSLPQDYYLFEYKDEELIEILLNRSEWSEFDYVISKKILSKRNVNLDEYPVFNNVKNNVKAASTDPEFIEESFTTENLVMSYFLALLFGPYFLVRYFVIITAKERLEDGSLAFKYDKNLRNNAIAICFIGFVSTLVWLVIFRYNYFKNL